MNRKSWILTSGSPSVRSIRWSSHQPRCQGEGPRPTRANSSRPISRALRSIELEVAARLAVNEAIDEPSVRGGDRDEVASGPVLFYDGNGLGDQRFGDEQSVSMTGPSGDRGTRERSAGIATCHFSRELEVIFDRPGPSVLLPDPCGPMIETGPRIRWRSGNPVRIGLRNRPTTCASARARSDPRLAARLRNAIPAEKCTGRGCQVPRLPGKGRGTSSKNALEPHRPRIRPNAPS